MGRFTSFLIYSVICYLLGIVFAQKTISAMKRLFFILKNPFNLVEELFISQGDRIFLVFVLLLPIGTYYFFYKSLGLDKLIQFLIVEGTFLAVIFSLIIKNDASKYRNRPIIDVKFIPEFPDYYHMTDMHILQNGAIIASLPTYYVRLKIGNSGKEPLKNVEVVLEDVRPRPDKFMSLNLSWAGYNNPLNDIKRTVNISKGQYRQLDVIEAIKPQIVASLSITLLNNNDPDGPRYKAYSEGFRSCTIKPNSLSDIYKFGGYMMYLRIYADNAEPKLIYLRVDYDGNWSDDPKTMKEKYLKVRLFT